MTVNPETTNGSQQHPHARAALAQLVDSFALAKADKQLLLRQLAEFQLELERQNQCLRLAQAKTQRNLHRLAKSEARFRAVFEQSSLGIALTHPETGRISEANQQFAAIVGCERERLRDVDCLSLVHPEDRANSLAQRELLKAAAIASFCEEKRYIRSDGSIVWVHVVVTSLTVDGGHAPYFMVMIENITERMRIQQALEERTAELALANVALHRLARHDELTGLSNRLAANERLHIEFTGMRRTHQPYSVLMMDLDLFKRVNDTYGHAVGDRVLRQLARTIEANLRESDFVARFGGEEFLALLPDTPLADAYQVAEKLREAVEAQPDPTAGRLTVSIGVALATPQQANEYLAVRLADDCLYEAKNLGRNRVVVHRA